MEQNIDISPELFDRIERFLLNKMDTAERADFIREMEKDLSLKREVKIQKDCMRAVQAGAMSKHLRLNDHEWITPVRNLRPMWYAAAAVIVVLFVIGWLFTSKPDSDTLFAKYAVNDPGLPVVMGSTDQVAFYDAMTDYKNEQYDTARAKWERMLPSSTMQDTLHYYIGSCYFNSENYTAAISSFSFFDEDQLQSPFYEKAEWYTVLASLKTGDDRTINRIAANTHSTYKGMITEIAKAIDRK
jgi:TolA-binding protein